MSFSLALVPELTRPWKRVVRVGFVGPLVIFEKGLQEGDYGLESCFIWRLDFLPS